MATPNPLASTFGANVPTISSKTFIIGGIQTTVYGLDELLPSQIEVGCLWLLHPRLQAHQCMEPVGAAAIQAWSEFYEKEGVKRAETKKKGLIAVAFDQRNHGSRLVSAQANEAWRAGNPSHAQDMFSVYEGTAHDLRHIQSHLQSYIFQGSGANGASGPKITQNLVLGISLGGHAAWHCLLHNPTVTSAIIIIGCPDYVRLMTDRAAKSKLPSYTSSNPPGSAFLGSKDFPNALLDVVKTSDPAALLMEPFVSHSKFVGPPDEPPLPKLGKYAPRITDKMITHLTNKRILNLAGGADKLVPYNEASWPFLQFLKDAIVPDLGPVGHGCPPRLAAMGYFEGGGIVLKDIVYEGVGHEMTPEMVKETQQFVVKALAEGELTKSDFREQQKQQKRSSGPSWSL
ncbi:MAG: Vesicle trafficking between the ER and Golgi [Chaenotheca gracillima]|nr:MAG: Vesicle trafficking between the ER and Golgi [Chaenotheca gracillima]